MGARGDLEGSIVLSGSFGETSSTLLYDQFGLVRLNEYDPSVSAREIELANFEQIAQADGLVVVNHRHLGNIGLRAAAEFAWATMCGVPRFVTYSPEPKALKYPVCHFTGQFTKQERDALQAISFGHIDVHHLLPEYRRTHRLRPLRPKDFREKAEAVPEHDPHFDILKSICRRLLEGLADERPLVIPGASSPHA